MPRDGNGVASKPAGTTATPNTLIESSKFNSVIDDIYALLNAALPITSGGTSAVSKQGAVSALFDGTTIVDDDNFTLAANGDQTKLLSLDLSGLTTATTRTQKAPDYDGTLASQALGSAIASAGTTDIGAASGSTVHVTGTTTITALGTADAGIEKTVVFDGILTLTHNATSLILPHGRNITTAAGDTAVFVSEGSGNWRCVVPPAGARWETIATYYTTSVPSIDITGLAAYKSLRISGMAKPAVDNQQLLLRTSTNDGSSYDAGATDYTTQFMRVVGATLDGASSTTSYIQLTPSAVGNAASEECSFDFTLQNFNKSTVLYAQGIARLQNPANTSITGTLSGRREDTTARNALQILFASGNISFINLTIEGVRG